MSNELPPPPALEQPDAQATISLVDDPGRDAARVPLHQSQVATFVEQSLPAPEPSLIPPTTLDVAAALFVTGIGVALIASVLGGCTLVCPFGGRRRARTGGRA